MFTASLLYNLIKTNFSAPECFSLSLLVISEGITQGLAGRSLRPPSGPQPSAFVAALFTYKLGFGSQWVYFTFYWSVRGNADRKTKQIPSRSGISKWAKYLKESNIRAPRSQSLSFLPYKAPSASPPALPGDKIAWRLITTAEKAVFTVELRWKSAAGLPVFPVISFKEPGVQTSLLLL